MDAGAGTQRYPSVVVGGRGGRRFQSLSARYQRAPILNDCFMSRSADRLRSSGQGPRAPRPTTPGDHDVEVSAVRRGHAAGAGRTPFMTVQRVEHIGIVVDDLAAATAFFAALGLELEGEASVEGDLVDRINGLSGVRADVVILRTPDGNGKVELAKYRTPAYDGDAGAAPANTPGIRHILFVVDDV